MRLEAVQTTQACTCPRSRESTQGLVRARFHAQGPTRAQSQTHARAAKHDFPNHGEAHLSSRLGYDVAHGTLSVQRILPLAQVRAQGHARCVAVDRPSRHRAAQLGSRVCFESTGYMRHAVCFLRGVALRAYRRRRRSQGARINCLSWICRSRRRHATPQHSSTIHHA